MKKNFKVFSIVDKYSLEAVVVTRGWLRNFKSLGKNRQDTLEFGPCLSKNYFPDTVFSLDFAQWLLSFHCHRPPAATQKGAGLFVWGHAHVLNTLRHLTEKSSINIELFWFLVRVRLVQVELQDNWIWWRFLPAA